MLKGHKGVVEHHPRPAVGHDGSNLLPHGRFVALDGAGVACSPMFLRAAARSFVGVLDGLPAICAERLAGLANMVMATAVDACHGHHGSLVLLDSLDIGCVQRAVCHENPLAVDALEFRIGFVCFLHNIGNDFGHGLYLIDNRGNHASGKSAILIVAVVGSRD